MKLRSGTKVPFLNKNLPKRKYTRAYENPLPEETEDQLATSFANLSLCEKHPSQSEFTTNPQFERSTSDAREFSFGEIPGTDGILELNETPIAFRPVPTRRSLAFENDDLDEICSFKKIQPTNFEALLNEYIEIFSRPSDEETIELTLEQNLHDQIQSNHDPISTFQVVFGSSNESDDLEGGQSEIEKESLVDMASDECTKTVEYSSTPIQNKIESVLSKFRKSIAEI